MANHAEIFENLKTLLQPFAADLKVKEDQPDCYVLIAKELDTNQKETFFAAVKIQKSYVSFHLMPIYDQPELLEGISAQLKQRLKGKTCFNFTKVNEKVFGDLGALTERGLEAYREKGLI